MGIDHGTNGVDCCLQTGFPIHDLPLTVDLHHGRLQAILAVQTLVAETITIRQPHFIDIFIFARHHAHHFTTPGMDKQVGTDTVMRRNGGVLLQFPGARLKAERLGCQRTHRTNVDDVAGQLGLQ